MPQWRPEARLAQPVKREPSNKEALCGARRALCLGLTAGDRYEVISLAKVGPRRPSVTPSTFSESAAFRQGGGFVGASGAPEALRPVESCYPLGYFAANTPAAAFSCPAAKAPVAACSMK